MILGGFEAKFTRTSFFDLTVVKQLCAVCQLVEKQLCVMLQCSNQYGKYGRYAPEKLV